MRVYVGTYTIRDSKGIYCFDLQESTGRMRLISTCMTDNPSYICLTEGDRNLYCVNETEKYLDLNGGSVSAFQMHEGNINYINSISAVGRWPCHITIWKGLLFSASFGDGILTAFELGKDGEILRECDRICHKQQGDIAPHMHFVSSMHDADILSVVDWGLDLIEFFILKDNHKLKKVSQIELMKGSGPRQIRYSADGKTLYIVCERSSTIEIFSWDVKYHTIIEHLQSISTRARSDMNSDNQGGLQNAAAALRITPNGRYIYVSNRGDNTICCFKVDKYTGRLTYQSVLYLPFRFPRDFNITQDGNMLLVASQYDDKIRIYKINTEEGTLIDTEEACHVPSPVCIEFDNKQS